MQDNYVIKVKPTTSHNHAKVNAIIEQMHKVVNHVLISFYLQNNHENLATQQEEDNPFDCFLQSTASLPSY
jgi:hypothetical protein